ncbi:MAG: acyl-CoA thioesterase [Planctomycetota bacterium]|jgi:YbgC/YbaW family acyl-CoA thioester hydrolase
MPHEFTMQRMVEFAETDMAGIMHFSNYFRFMEATEHAFFRSFGYCLHRDTPDGGTLGFARVHAECSYARPLRYQDLVEVRLLVREVKTRSISYQFVFRTGADDGGELQEVARGSMTVVCVAKAPGDERMRAIPIPAEVAAHVVAAPAELLQ